MPASRRTLTLPRGLLSLAALAWIACLLTAGIWTMAGIGPGLIAAGVLGGLALIGAELVTAPDSTDGARRG